VWQDKHFIHTSQGEEHDVNWQGQFRKKAFPRIGAMIADIHLTNTASRIDRVHNQFRRVPEWDDYCRQRSLAEFMKGRK
jgi:hypothetical protein